MCRCLVALPGMDDEETEYDDEEEYGECLVMSLCVSHIH